jgi:ABC-type bacteriocin/lantibiotic exporter with double-glycine peptidase domain
VIIQPDSYSCGACAIHNAMQALGHDLELDDIQEMAGTDEDGTDEKGIKRALEQLGYTGEVIASKGDEFWADVTTAVGNGDPVILSTEDYDHWVTVVGVSGDRVVVFDSENTKANLDESGVHVVDQDGLTKMIDGGKYALRVVPKFGTVVSKAMKRSMRGS